MRYLLGDILLFDSNEGILCVAGSQDSAKLPYAAALVLQVLCDNSQVLITRNELMDRAWTENGLRASGSNLYNSLSLIRRTVASLGVELQIIRTQPKVGLIMAVAVVRLDEAEPPVIRTETMDVNSESELSQDDPHTSGVTAVPPAPQQHSAALPEPKQRAKTRDWSFYLLWTVLMVISALIIRMITLENEEFIDLIPENHFKMGAVGGCTLFRFNDESDVFPGAPLQEKIIMVAKRYDVDCQKRKVDFYVYSRFYTHNSFDGTAQLNVVCDYNKKNNVAIECFNDFNWQQRK